ncbi:beta-lactamase [Pyrenochaeta sp. MPI-SDFR-AT-0127]|nr:beta-lactamase [Pyrenochaeta sp. MPI-SDFR-AT-0127]
MAKVEGTFEDRFASVQKLLQSYIDNGDELGASLVVNIDGKDVVDIWGGYADQDHSRPWKSDTITNVWSTSKTITSLAALVLIDRGQLDPFEKVAKYWPEFGANGKENVEVRHLLSHSSGVSGWAEKLTFDDVCDLEKSSAMLAAQAPWWEPGTASGYQSMSMGHLVSGVVRGVTGKTLGQFITEELAKPLDADFQLGVRDEDLHRVSDNIPPPPPTEASPLMASLMDPNSLTSRTMLNPPIDGNIANTPVWRKAEVGAANGHTNARGVNRLLSQISIGGGSLLSPKTIDLIFQTQTDGKDLVLGEHLRLGIGYGLTGKHTWMNWLPEGRICMWGGWGGSVAIMDLDRKLTITYAMNKMENAGMGNDRTKAYVDEVYKVLGVE